MSAVSPEAQEALAGIAGGRPDALERALASGARVGGSALDRRTVGLVRIAALIALDGPPSSYAWQVAEARASGATLEEITAVLLAIGSDVGEARMVAAAPELMLALGMSLPDE